MSFISRAARAANTSFHTFRDVLLPLRNLDRRVSDLAKTIIGKNLKEEKILSFEEFKKLDTPLSKSISKGRSPLFPN